MVAFKNGPPLVVGLGEKETVVASDIQAIIQHTNRVIYPDDLEIVKVRGTDVEVFSADGKPLKKQVHTVTWNAERSWLARIGSRKIAIWLSLKSGET